MFWYVLFSDYLPINSGPPYEHCWLDANSNIHCYYIIEDVDAIEARTACATPGGHLATIENIEEKDSVRNYTLERKKTAYFYMF